MCQRLPGNSHTLGFSWQTPPVLSQRFQQLGAEHDVAILAALSTLDVKDHSPAVDVADLQTRQLGSAHSGRVERHQDGAIEQSGRRIDPLRDFLGAENPGQPDDSLWVRGLVDTPGLLECLDEEEPQCPDALVDAVGGQLSFAKQVGLVLANVLRAQRVGRLMEIAGEILNGHEVRPHGTL